ncbi:MULTISPECIES: RluA family pseudouridine synthase [Aerococcus]|uniref:RluA family pseudouridine synthase n=1 Tax=Aerococcus TaxID=1375 RepID=UPI0018A7231A|nr:MULTISPECIES: RluA family pseudouridine synthase [Aerococcus]MCY3035802.1 RluA family pseudouridine synthase [Aerococcus sp. Group 2]MCY3040243.1 RluA family pseudouridine synthase [Aerococcus sp. Group 2]MCY3040469.1 RluA family pseudouridine synthase [Aerococcus sp. Group 2]MCY3043636.1 RluA family pseudouridine synthase [Aerococcus sp. Group 2]MDK6519914.1 RluA family pseudouridine synthase [Aerococcus urinae]
MLEKSYEYHGDQNLRLDRYLSQRLDSYSRSEIAQWIKTGQVKVNKQVVKPSYRLSPMDKISLAIEEEQKLPIVGESLDLDIVYEDKDLLVINKAKGMVVHPSKGHLSGTLVNALLAYAQKSHFTLSDLGDYYRPGIVHRLDKDTSGLMVVAKSDQAYQALLEDLANHQVVRKYLALIYGHLPDKQGTIDIPLRRHPKDRMRYVGDPLGKEAVTHFKQIAQVENYALLRLSLETGRTHQIRAHLAYLDHPVVDDPLYAKAYQQRFFSQQGQCLHAYGLSFNHPITKEKLSFQVKPPKIFMNILDKALPNYDLHLEN